MKTTIKQRNTQAMQPSTGRGHAIKGPLAQLKKSAAGAPAVTKLADLTDKDELFAAAEPKSVGIPEKKDDILAKDEKVSAAAEPKKSASGAAGEEKFFDGRASVKDDRDPKSAAGDADERAIDDVILRKRIDTVQRAPVEEEELLQGKGLPVQRAAEEDELQM